MATLTPTVGELLRVCFPTLHLCQDGGPDGRGDTLIQLGSSFSGIRVVTTIRALRPKNHSSIPGVGKISLFLGLWGPLRLQFNRYGEIFLQGRGDQGVSQGTINYSQGKKLILCPATFAVRNTTAGRGRRRRSMHCGSGKYVCFLLVTNQRLIPRSSSPYGCHYVRLTSQRKSIFIYLYILYIIYFHFVTVQESWFIYIKKPTFCTKIHFKTFTY